jgi:hypothetical protein
LRVCDFTQVSLSLRLRGIKKIQFVLLSPRQDFSYLSLEDLMWFSCARRRGERVKTK